ncbi:MAG: 6-bladed beta-propeller, partial [Acidimicrobiia bacterium]
IEVDSQNSVFVTDLFGARVQKFSAAGQYITEWGDGGTDPGQFLLPLDLAVDSADNVFVSDPFFNNRVQEFDNNGSYIDFWSISEGPAGIDIDTASDLAYVTTGEDTVVKIDATDGAVITQWGATGTGEGQFDEPQGIVVASNGLIYVTDRANDRVQYFDSDGTFLGQWGTPTDFNEIIGIAATAGGEGTGNR